MGVVAGVAVLDDSHRGASLGIRDNSAPDHEGHSAAACKSLFAVFLSDAASVVAGVCMLPVMANFGALATALLWVSLVASSFCESTNDLFLAAFNCLHLPP